MKTWHSEILYKTNLQLGESPHWHTGWKKYLYVDIEGKKIGCIDPVTRIIEERNAGKKISSVVPAANGNLIAALKGSLAEINFLTGTVNELVQVEVQKPYNRCNDGKCDVKGRFWIGTMHEDAKGTEGALYYFDGKLHKKLEGRKVSNGICWSLDNKTMYYIDSFIYSLNAFDFDSSSGNISNERIITEMNEPGCIMDGMTIDSEGMLWVAIWGGGCVNRYNPFTGELTGKIWVDAPLVTSCCFGGENLQQLFITTARAGLTDELLKLYPNSGSLFIADTGIKGCEMNHYTEK